IMQPRVSNHPLRPDRSPSQLFFFLHDSTTTDIYTLSLHDALPIFHPEVVELGKDGVTEKDLLVHDEHAEEPYLALMLSQMWWPRSEEHTSELQSLRHLVCRLLLEKQKKINVHLH